MNGTGVFLTLEEYEAIVESVRSNQTIEIDLQRGQNTYTQNKRPASELLQGFAIAKGLPALEGGKGYGLTSNREIVAP